jgi:hypothetical protein
MISTADHIAATLSCINMPFCFCIVWFNTHHLAGKAFEYAGCEGGSSRDLRTVPPKGFVFPDRLLHCYAGIKRKKKLEVS